MLWFEGLCAYVVHTTHCDSSDANADDANDDDKEENRKHEEEEEEEWQQRQEAGESRTVELPRKTNPLFSPAASVGDGALRPA